MTNKEFLPQHGSNPFKPAELVGNGQIGNSSGGNLPKQEINGDLEKTNRLTAHYGNIVLTKKGELAELAYKGRVKIIRGPHRLQALRTILSEKKPVSNNFLAEAVYGKETPIKIAKKWLSVVLFNLEPDLSEVGLARASIKDKDSGSVLYYLAEEDVSGKTNVGESDPANKYYDVAMDEWITEALENENPPTFEGEKIIIDPRAKKMLKIMKILVCTSEERQMTNRLLARAIYGDNIPPDKAMEKIWGNLYYLKRILSDNKLTLRSANVEKEVRTGGGQEKSYYLKKESVESSTGDSNEPPKVNKSDPTQKKKNSKEGKRGKKAILPESPSEVKFPEDVKQEMSKEKKRIIEKKVSPMVQGGAIAPKVTKTDPKIISSQSSDESKILGRKFFKPETGDWGKTPFNLADNDLDFEADVEIDTSEGQTESNGKYKLSPEEICAFGKVLECDENKDILEKCGIKVDQTLRDRISSVYQHLGSDVDVSSDSFKTNAVPAFLKRLAGLSHQDWVKIVFNNKEEMVRSVLSKIAYIDDEKFNSLIKGLKYFSKLTP